jgi:diguanylate cyclase (GGDEF)-like protein/PAS domain S-box-containing protein
VSSQEDSDREDLEGREGPADPEVPAAADDDALVLGGVAQALVEDARDVITVITPRGLVRYANGAAQRFLGRRWVAGETVDVYRITHPDDRERIRRHVRAALLRRGRTEPIQLRMMHADGTWRTVEAWAENHVRDPVVRGFVLTIRDVSKRLLAEERASLQAARQADLAELGRRALAAADLDAVLDDALVALTSRFGAECAHVLEAVPGADLLALRSSVGHPGSSDGVALISSAPTGSPAGLALASGSGVVSDDLATETRFEVPSLWADAGCAAIIEVPIPGPEEPFGVLGVGHRSLHRYGTDDVHFVEAVANVLAAAVTRDRTQDVVRRESHVDRLTGLPNKLALLEHLDTLLAETPGRALPGTLCVIDIDRLREINDTLGHAVGDQVLVGVADRLRAVADQIDIVARVGGDEFGVYSSTVRDRAAAEEMGARLLAALREPANIDGAHIALRGRAGVAGAGPIRPSVERPDGDNGGHPVRDAISLLWRAESALYEAKRVAVDLRSWTPDLDRRSAARLGVASELNEALGHGDIYLAYQPKVDCFTSRPTGAEELIRWRHATRGVLLPDSFIPLAEQTGMIKALTRFVLDKCLGERSRWLGFDASLTMGVNIATSMLHDPELPDLVEAALEQTGVPPSAVQLEITEAAVMAEPKLALQTMEGLAALGVGFALDDFGTGYSSLTFLERLPVSLVKIDRSFIAKLGVDAQAHHVVLAVIGLAHSLGVRVLAEGVETADAARIVTDLGCDEMQGFYIAEPMEARDVTPWLGSWARTFTP